MKFVFVGQRFIPLEEPPPIMKHRLERRATRIPCMAIIQRLNNSTFPGHVDENGNWDRKLEVITKEIVGGVELEVWRFNGQERKRLCCFRDWHNLLAWLEGFQCKD